jgi:hypothetical protein
MPVRPRRARRSKHTLTLWAYMTLTIGPLPGELFPLDDPAVKRRLTQLRAVFDEHRRRLQPNDWAVRLFEHDEDIRDPVETTGIDRDAPVGLPGV